MIKRMAWMTTLYSTTLLVCSSISNFSACTIRWPLSAVITIHILAPSLFLDPSTKTSHLCWFVRGSTSAGSSSSYFFLVNLLSQHRWLWVSQPGNLSRHETSEMSVFRVWCWIVPSVHFILLTYRPFLHFWELIPKVPCLGPENNESEISLQFISARMSCKHER